jgi:5-methylcytosine-specific restriction endonuclease McrA
MGTHEVIAQACALLTNGNEVAAGRLIDSEYPFKPFLPEKRTWSALASTQVFWRDGFTCRYCERRLVFPGALRILSTTLPDQFPYHPNWKTTECHFGYWELSPTVDHVVPISREGTESDANWVTACWLCNSRKSHFSIDELGWTLKRQSRIEEWDGLLRWFVEFAESNPKTAMLNGLARWHSAASKVIRAARSKGQP